MPSPFAITTATNTVSLDNNRQGQASFIVSNTTNYNVRGRAHIVALSTNAEPWLKLAGEAERDFVHAGSQQYVVQIAVPQDAPAGDSTFRLDVVDVADPDDNFTQGPTVKFVVPAPPAPPKEPFPWWIVALAVLILLGGTIGVILAVHNASVSKAHAEATATAVVQVHATATAQVNATATALALYPSIAGTYNGSITVGGQAKAIQLQVTQADSILSGTTTVEGTTYGNTGTITHDGKIQLSVGGVARFDGSIIGRGHLAGTWRNNNSPNPEGTWDVSKVA